MFKVGDIVKYAEKFSAPGEQYYIHVVKETFEDSNRVLIHTLNSPLVLGSSEWVTEDMIEKASKYEVIVCRNSDRQIKYVITNTETKKCFSGYDFMGTANWVDALNDAYAMDLDEAESILADLKASDDEPAEEAEAIDQHDVETFIEKIEKVAWKLSEARCDSGENPFPRDGLYPAKPIRKYLAFMNPSADWVRSLLKAKPKAVALALLNNDDDLDAIAAVTKLF